MNISKLPPEQKLELELTVSLALDIMNSRNFEKKVAGKIAAKQKGYKPLGHVYAMLDELLGKDVN